MQRLTLAQQIAQLETTAPTDFDPEDIQGESAKDHVAPANDEDVEMDAHDPNAGREHYVDVGPSELRKLRDSVADPKYDGVKMSRQQLQTLSESEDEEIDEIGVDGSVEGDQSETSSIHGDSLSSGFEDEDDERDGEAHSLVLNGTESTALLNPQDDASHSLPQQHATLISSLQRTRVADKLKGKAVSRQLAIWDSLVDARIRLQKSVAAVNKLPRPENIAPYVSTSAGRAAARQFLVEALQLSEDIFELRHTLLAQTGSIQPPRKKRRIDTDQEELDLEQIVGESTAEMTSFDAQTHPDKLSTIQKWSSKVQAVAPSALTSLSRVPFKTGPTYLKSAAELVEDALREQDKAVKRTWGKDGRAARIGEKSEKTQEGEDDGGDEEAFDDRDFYQTMLRDVIESKGGKDAIDAPDLYANSRKQKKKKQVDTKASKGRKLRYEPHEKLQNFMVPIPVRGAWHEEQIDELFASLLGKGFHDDEPVVVTNGSEMVPKETETLQGFRIFG